MSAFIFASNKWTEWLYVHYLRDLFLYQVGHDTLTQSSKCFQCHQVTNSNMLKARYKTIDSYITIKYNLTYSSTNYKNDWITSM